LGHSNKNRGDFDVVDPTALFETDHFCNGLPVVLGGLFVTPKIPFGSQPIQHRQQQPLGQHANQYFARLWGQLHGI
jgi:hypothetical protein